MNVGVKIDTKMSCRGPLNSPCRSAVSGFEPSKGLLQASQVRRLFVLFLDFVLFLFC